MPEQSESYEAIREKIRTGWQLNPDDPHVQEAAREVIRPLVENMAGQKILYHCRVTYLMRVDQVSTDDNGFTARATVLDQFPDPEMDRYSPRFTTPFEFYGSWSMFHLCGRAIKFAMCTDRFIVDPDIVAAAEAAGEVAAAGRPPDAVYQVIRRACDPAATRPRGS